MSPLAREVTEAVLQIHGGIGHTWEHSAHYFLRRALLSRRTLGDESVHLAHIADGVVAGGAGTDGRRRRRRRARREGR